MATNTWCLTSTGERDSYGDIKALISQSVVFWNDKTTTEKAYEEQ